MTISPVANAPRPTPNPLVLAEPRKVDLGPHTEAAERNWTDLVGGAQGGGITTETLPNGVRMVIADRPGAKSVKVQVGIGAGSFQDFPGRLGMAHLLEHLAFEGSPTRPATEQERLRASLGNDWNAYTNQSYVVYYGVVPKQDAVKGAALLTDMFRNPKLTGPRVEQEHAAVKNEMTYWGGSLAAVADDVANRQLFGDGPATNNVIGTRKTVAATTNADLKRFHQQYFVGRNTVALVEGDATSLPVATLRRELGKLEPGHRVDNSAIQANSIPGQSLQLLDDPSSSTVGLQVNLPVTMPQLMSVRTPGQLVTTALTDRLNLKLRRNDHLTYGAGAKLVGGSGDTPVVLQISTTVDKKHQAKAMEDILATLTDAEDGFGPKTFQTYRSGVLSRLEKAEAAPRPTTTELAELTFQNALATGSSEVAPPPDTDTSALRTAVRATTPEQFAADMGTMIDLNNLKVLASGAVGDGAALRAGMRAGGVDTKAVTMNPVDLGLYRDMGIKVPAQGRR